MSLRWKKEPKATGLLAVGANRQPSVLHDGQQVYARVYEHGWRSHRDNQWYWVAGWGSGVPSRNTCNEPSLTEEQAKANAAAYVKDWLAKTNGDTA